jgi:hypothetical protein
MSAKSRDSTVPEKTSAAGQWLCKHASTATKPRFRVNEYTNATIEELYEAVFSVGSVQGLYKESQLGNWVSSTTGSLQPVEARHS